MSIEIDVLKQYLGYEPRTGDFHWKKRTPGNKSIKVGSEAGNDRGDGYWYIGVLGKRYLKHHLVWAFEKGKFPTLIDHIDGDPSNNHITNLRDVTGTINNQNRRGPKKTHPTGLLGVSKKGLSFEANIVIDGKKKYIGRFETPEQAYLAYVENKRKYHEGNTL